jgi:hypothetical protein
VLVNAGVAERTAPLPVKEAVAAVLVIPVTTFCVPNVGSDPVTLTASARETTTKTVDWVYELSQKYSIDALTFIEAHTNFNILTEYAEIGREEKAKLANETLEDGAPGRK